LATCGNGRQPQIEHPNEPVGIAPLRLALHDEGLAANRELIAGAWARHLARPQLEGRGLGMDAGFAEADDRVGTLRDHPHRRRLAAGGRVDGIDAEGGEGRVHRASNTVIRCACP
jgi:hypothetical protein